jgi:hypothetical protein
MFLLISLLIISSVQFNYGASSSSSSSSSSSLSQRESEHTWQKYTTIYMQPDSTEEGTCNYAVHWLQDETDDDYSLFFALAPKTVGDKQLTQHYSEKSFNRAFAGPETPFIQIIRDAIVWRPYPHVAQRTGYTNDLIQEYRYLPIFCSQKIMQKSNSIDRAQLNDITRNIEICEALTSLGQPTARPTACLQGIRYNYLLVDIREIASKLYGIQLPSVQETSLSHDAIRSLLSGSELQPTQPIVSTQAFYLMAAVFVGLATRVLANYKK